MLLALDRPVAKTCNQCGVAQPFGHFKPNKNVKDGRLNTCRSCLRAANRTYSQTPSFKARMARNTLRWKEAKTEAYLLAKARSRARAKGLDFSLTEADIQVPERCPVLGIELKRGDGATHGQSPSLDRIDSSKGYVPGNVWVVSLRANMLKSDATLDELRALVRGLEKVRAN